MVVGGDASAVLLLAMMMMFYFTLSIFSLKSMIFLSEQIFFKNFSCMYKWVYPLNSDKRLFLMET